MSQAFFYVDGIPTKGMWVDLDLIDNDDEVREQLVKKGLITEDYDGDILVADAEGLAMQFLNSCGVLDLDDFV